MRMNGREIKGLNIETVVIPRPPYSETYTDEAAEQQTRIIPGDLVFKAQAIGSFEEFDALAKEPNPPIKTLPGGLSISDTQAPSYKKKLAEYVTLKTNWIVIKSLQATPDLVFDKVDLTKPETFGLWQDELREADLSQPEINKIFQATMAANALDENKLNAARERFLLAERSTKST